MPAKTVTYLGSEGSHSHQVSLELFPDSVHRGLPEFEDVTLAVERGEADFAIVAVENTLGGRVEEPHRLLAQTKLNICQEYILPIHHCLVVPMAGMAFAPSAGSGADATWDSKQKALSPDQRKQILAGIREIHSHPQALRQCRGFLARELPAAVRRDTADTATAAKDISTRRDHLAAAISSKMAARIYDMLVLCEDVEDDADNATRFLVLSRHALKNVPPVFPALTTILFKSRHEPGALISALKAFADAGINLTKLETYLASRERRQSTFYVDVGEHYFSERMAAAMKVFASHVEEYKILGTYSASPLRGIVAGFLAV